MSILKNKENQKDANKPSYHVTINWQSIAGNPHTKTAVVIATDEEEATLLVESEVKKLPNFLKIHGGSCVEVESEAKQLNDAEIFINFLKAFNSDNESAISRLMLIYRFFNSFIKRGDMNSTARFAESFFDLSKHDPSMLRMTIDVLKQVSDEELIRPLYLKYIAQIESLIGKIA